MKTKLLALALAFAVTVGLLMVTPIAAADPFEAAADPFEACAQNPDSSICADKDKDTKLFGSDSIWTNIINIILTIMGGVAVIVIIVGGIRYVTSAGDASAVTAAKNTILFAVVGLVLAIMAGVIVNFVLSRITG